MTFSFIDNLSVQKSVVTLFTQEVSREEKQKERQKVMIQLKRK